MLRALIKKICISPPILLTVKSFCLNKSYYKNTFVTSFMLNNSQSVLFGPYTRVFSPMTKLQPPLGSRYLAAKPYRKQNRVPYASETPSRNVHCQNVTIQVGRDLKWHKNTSVNTPASLLQGTKDNVLC